ncbi:MAG: hypothetical protein ACM31M_02380 [Nitrososphaerota archaeon]
MAIADVESKFSLERFKGANDTIILLMRTYFVKSVIVTSLIVAIFLTNIAMFGKVTAETGVGNDVFKVIVSLFDITNSTKDITTIVNVKDQTKVKVFNAEDPESQDKVSYTITFPNLAVDDGEPYTVCTVSSEDLVLKCMEGQNSPLNRPEFVDVNVSEGATGEDEDVEEEED